MTGDSSIGVGVLGATGYIGQPYRAEVRASPGTRIVALAARRKGLLAAAARDDGATTVTDNWREVVEHPDVQLVIVATPDALHHEAVMACARAGKHVLCEKPVGVDRRQAQEMWEAYRDAPSLFHFVPFWTRYVPVFHEAKQIVDSGKLGRIQGVVYRWHNPRPRNMPFTWRDDADHSAGGSIADVGSHAYDTVRWLIKDEASRVLVHAATVTPAKADLGAINLDEALNWEPDAVPPPKKQATTPDYANISWEFTNGAVGTLIVSHASFFRRGICPEFELHGSDASLALNRVSGEIWLATPDGAPEQAARVTDTGFGNRFERYVFPAFRSFPDTAATYPTLEDGWRVQCFLDACLESASSGTWADV